MNSYLFPKTIEPNVGESLYGFVKRLAIAYGWTNLGSFMMALKVHNIHQVNWFVLSDVTERIVSNFAMSLQLDESLLSKQLFEKDTYASLTLNHRQYGSHAVRKIRVCPECVSEGASHQLFWQHVANGYCEKHHCELVSHCQHCHSPIQIEYGSQCASCFKSLHKEYVEPSSIIPVLQKLARNEQLQLMNALEEIIIMLRSDGDAFTLRSFFENNKPILLSKLYFEGLLILISSDFKAMWQHYIAKKRQDFSVLGTLAVNLPFQRLTNIDPALLRKVTSITNEQCEVNFNSHSPDFSLYDSSVGNKLSPEDISFFCGIKKAEFRSLSQTKWLVQPKGVSCNSKILFDSQILMRGISSTTISLSNADQESTDMVCFNSKKLDAIKFAGLNKIQLLMHANSNNISIYLADSLKDTLIDKLFIVKSDLYKIILNHINIDNDKISKSKLAGMFGTTSSKIDVMIKCGFIKYNRGSVSVDCFNQFFNNFDVLNRIGKIKKINIKKLVNLLEDEYDLRPAFAFKTEKLDVLYIYNKTDKFSTVINKLS
ncbi:TniQ family protein [Colwellia sp. MB3u-4]|uniref:TniQ family protein n=1 Tax=Colwellia sp. MB3u-4 TaxID=2759822 RepID=UPI0015F6615B|nr:TniQ family protein [Colwellia sp. MB3u-4]MBA6288571.1 TniQ family protein [Colwellia sp. MB3u-4]